MEWFDAESYTVARAVLQRGIAAVFVVAFVAVLLQFRPLLGERGLLPVPASVARVPFRSSPSLFHWRYSDALVTTVAVVGVALGLVLAVGLPQQGPPWVPMLAFGLGSGAQLRWFVPFLRRLLEADRATLALLAHDPFDGARPRWVRARMYRYRFATPAERPRDGVRWVRADLGLLVDVQDLRSLARAR